MKNLKWCTLVCSAFFTLCSVQLFSQQPNTAIRTSNDADLDSLKGAFDFKAFLLGDVNRDWLGLEVQIVPSLGQENKRTLR